MIDLGAFCRHDAANAVHYEACTKGHTQAHIFAEFLHQSISTQDPSVLQDGRIGMSIETLARLAKVLYVPATVSSLIQACICAESLFRNV